MKEDFSTKRNPMHEARANSCYNCEDPNSGWRLAEKRSSLKLNWMDGIQSKGTNDKTTRRTKIVADTKTTLTESGDLIIPIERKVISKDDIYAELAEIVSGRKPRRISKDEITCFKSIGLAIKDTATAKLIYDKTIKEKIGMR